VKIDEPKGLNRRELAGCQLTSGLAGPIVVTMAGLRSLAAAPAGDLFQSPAIGSRRRTPSRCHWH
jgi:hypothetical protein